MSERALFTALLVIYMVHQIEEHLWPGGFRQFANACVFRSGDDNWPVGVGGVALVNVGFVWLPLGTAVLWQTRCVAPAGRGAVRAALFVVPFRRGRSTPRHAS
jgi:hypothetical protein